MGQILNRNAQWISQKVYELGVATSCHLCVPDDRALILDALHFCADHSDILFITGGLGPTSDDFTREVIANWCQRPLQFDPDSWHRIEKIFNERGVPLREFQKQQCYFPQNAQILTNHAGTAHGFALDHRHQSKNLRIFVLPGPPREIETIWQDHIFQELTEKTKNLDSVLTVSWDTQGLGESEVAFRFEAAIRGCPFTVAYRVHKPFVEVKLTYFRSQSEIAKEWINKAEQALADITVARHPAPQGNVRSKT